MRAIDEAAKTHQQDDVSGVTAGHDSVEMSVDIIGLAFPHQLVGGHTTKAGQWLCAKPGIGRQVGTCVGRYPVENFKHLTQPCLCLPCLDARSARERVLTQPRWIDPAVDPNQRAPNRCYLGDPRAANSGPAGLARFTTLRSWLSQWSFDKSRARSADNAPAISVPALVIENRADDAMPASHPRKIFELLGSPNKRFERIDGATHYYRGQPAHQAHAVSLLKQWMSEHIT